MKRISLMLLFGIAVTVISAQPALAIKDFSDSFNENYVENSDNDGLKAAAAEAKCNVCHYGKSKKNRNDFGKALAMHITKDKFTEMKKEDADKAKQAVKEALEKAVAEKKEGDTTFADVIKSGKLPGTNPEE